jgi:hypothetical protein
MWLDFASGWSWTEFVVQASASLLGAAIAAFVALRVVRVESRARLRDELRRDLESEAAEAIRLRAMRGEAIGSLLAGLVPLANGGKPFVPNREIELDALRLTFDGTPESYEVYRWTIGKLWEGSNLPIRRTMLSSSYELVRAMLSGWISIDDAGGVVASIRNDLEQIDANRDPIQDLFAGGTPPMRE